MAGWVWTAKRLFFGVFGDLRRVPVKREAQKASSTKSCVLQFLHDYSTQLCSYLSCRLVGGQGQGTRKEFDHYAVL